MYTVLDSSVFMNVNSLDHLDLTSSFYISENCYDEIKSTCSHLLSLLVKLNIVSPTSNSIKYIEETLKKIGETKLSSADKSALALALDLTQENKNVILLSDDFSVLNVASFCNIPSKSIKTKKKVKKRTYFFVCRACKNNNGVNNVECETCGFHLFFRKYR